MSLKTLWFKSQLVLQVPTQTSQIKRNYSSANYLSTLLWQKLCQNKMSINSCSKICCLQSTINCRSNQKTQLQRGKQGSTAAKVITTFATTLFKLYVPLHTYTHNCPIKFFNQNYGLGSHTTHVVRVNFTREYKAGYTV